MPEIRFDNETALIAALKGSELYRVFREEHLPRKRERERQAWERIQANRGSFTPESLTEIFDLISEDPSRQLWFGVIVTYASRKLMFSAPAEEMNRWFETILSAGGATEGALDVCLRQARIPGAGRALATLLLYLSDPEAHNAWVPMTLKGLQVLGRLAGLPGNEPGRAYAAFNRAALSFRESHGFQPQEVDWVLVVLGKYARADNGAFFLSQDLLEGRDVVKPRASDPIAALRKLFLSKAPGFLTFEEPGEKFWEQEIEYKQKACAAARARLEPFVRGEATFTKDEDARQVATELFGHTNFLNWRDTGYVDGELLAETGAWVDFFTRVLACLRETPGGDWQEPLGSLLDWLSERKCKANISKLLPTYFLFLWNPENHFFIKPSMTDRFLKALGSRHLGGGKPLTVESYERLLAVCQELRETHLADWAPRDNVDLHSFAWVVTGGWGEAAEECPSEVKEKTETYETTAAPLPSVERPDMPLNLILAGPPGTGKTYRLRTEYRHRFEEKETEQTLDDFTFERCADLTWSQVCLVALAYLERPATVPEIVVSPPVVAKARAQGRTNRVNPTVWTSLQEYTVEGCPNVNVKNRFEPGLFWKDSDTHWKPSDQAREVAPDLFELAGELHRFQPRKATAMRYEFVTFHQSYSYEDFVEGIKPVMAGDGAEGDAGQVRYDVVDGIFKRLVHRALADPHHSYALFIDEVNRANVSNVFGELIALIEDDKRMRYDQASGRWIKGMRVKLPYTHSARPGEALFGVPDNLYLVGTMNTADRSIALMDLALRRRFTFDEVMPTPGVLLTSPGPVETEDGEVIHLDRMLSAINERIEYLIDRDHTVGHSYLMKVKTLDDLVRTFRTKLLPLLQEYFYNDWEKIQMVLADLADERDSDGRPKAHPEAIVGHLVQRPTKLFGLNDEAYQERRSYAVNEDLSARSFQKIYQGR